MDEKKRYREFTITPGLKGFKVKIGCSECYFTNVHTLSAAISDYLIDPQGYEKDTLAMDHRHSSPKD